MVGAIFESNFFKIVLKWLGLNLPKKESIFLTSIWFLYTLLKLHNWCTSCAKTRGMFVK